ncbi:uncharacterized protein MYCFIDRAFT_182071 [Pseudocercospora fijiensis CIRAD86]|uniref:AA1-like domain-containing protein n=1 Tax=Pseudocercospora fijiensis (strain CIRAD86) TaxID=383855 RepID=M3A6S1_PSEFD|nr:uncharacterized protein MYCFIDRAFT_182071 [Pseudocercospora fijiensis CIRAD86]EME86784.1 hypothetical protein MYCFIDRAFT_182071 [Pseudocercospora fijiensis CIRAD86]
MFSSSSSSSSKLLALLLAPSTTAAALYFHLSPFHTTTTPTTHALNFTISNPNAVYEQGGSASRHCNLTWSTTPPTCLTECSDSGYPYFFRIRPDSYKHAGEFELEVLEYYVYKNSVINNATISLREGEEGYGCVRGGEGSVVCGFEEGEGVDVSFKERFGVGYPEDVCE